MYVISLDPGDTTGVAILDIYDGDLYCFTVKGVEDLHRAVKFRTKTLKSDLVHAIVCEDFILRPNRAQYLSGNKLVALRMIGAAELLAVLYGTRIVSQQPSIKQAWPDKRLLEYYTHVRRLNAHERDALRHLYCFLRKEGID